MGCAAGLYLRAWGGFRSEEGRSTRAASIAACTSRRAPSMLRLMSNCRVTLVEPTREEDVISVTSAMAPRCRSKGVATEVDMVTGLAPERLAVTLMVGRSVLGIGDTGSSA